MHILIPLDGTLRAETVLHPLAVLARRAISPLTVTLVTVLAPDEDNRHLQTYLAAMQQHPDLAALTVQTRRVAGNPADGICRTSQAVGADLIMMASHMTTLDPATGKSVAETVARCADTPTLVIRPEGMPFPDLPRYLPLTVGMVVDDPQTDGATYAPCVRFATAFDADIMVLTEQGKAAEPEYRALTVMARQMGASGIAVSRLMAPRPMTDLLNEQFRSGHLALFVLRLVRDNGEHPTRRLQTLLGEVIAPTLLFHETSPGDAQPPPTHGFAGWKALNVPLVKSGAISQFGTIKRNKNLHQDSPRHGIPNRSRQ